MRGIARLLFTLFSAASLLLCLAVCALWLRSHFYSDELDVLRTDAARPNGTC